MRWYAFFEPARANTVKSVIAWSLWLGIGVGVLPGHPVAAQEKPRRLASQVSPSPAPSATLEAEIASLPAFDVEQKKSEPKASVRVGDQIPLIIVGALNASGISASELRGWKLELPAGASPLTDQGWALFQGALDSGGPGGGDSALSFVAVPLKPGDLILPSMVLRSSQGKALGRTHPFKLSVASSIRREDPKPEQAEPLRPPVSLSFPWWIIILAGMVALFALGLGIYQLVLWSRARKKALPVAKAHLPPLPEDEAALLALADVEKSGFARAGDFKRHYFRVSEILKSYIGARFKFDALESTSDEVLLYFRQKKGSLDALDDVGFERLERLFEQLDQVKFTDHRPQSEDAAFVLNEARSFVQATRKIQVEVRPEVATEGSSGTLGAVKK